MTQWTTEQLAAITESGCDLLVSANAGAGKTAVLVERISQLALSGDSPVDLDRFLVVTFTEAAASEMRAKIGATLHARLANDPSNDRIRRQVLLLDQAQISTIHAFCLSILRRHFHKLGLDPDFSILDEEEGYLLRSEIIRMVFETQYESKEPVFLNWIGSFPGANPDQAASQIILTLYSFLQSLESPGKWIEQIKDSYPLGSDGQSLIQPFPSHSWFPDWKVCFDEALNTLKANAAAAMALAKVIEPKYLEWLEPLQGTLSQIEQASKADLWSEVISTIQSHDFGRMPGIRNKTAECEDLKATLDALKVLFKGLMMEGLASATPQQAAQAHANAAPIIHLMMNLVALFHARYAEAKRARAVVDFNDLEQLSLDLLRAEEGAPSEIARSYQDQFDFVLIDEYQDINPVQEEMLRLVSRRDDPRHPNNFFAVGDVKQSIYAFRLAEPAIFLGKYHSFPNFSKAGASDSTACKQYRIDLNWNFRSRDRVLEAVNYIFRRIMSRESSAIDYDDAAALKPGAKYPPLAGANEKSPSVEVMILESELDDSEGTGEEGGDEVQQEEPAAESACDWETVEREAYAVAMRIKEIVEPRDCAGKDSRTTTKGVPVFDRKLPGGDTGDASALRPAAYRDIVVLMRSIRGKADSYISVFNRFGIPVYADLGTGYFAALEIRDMLNLLRLIDNPLQDIPLAAVLRSPLENWSEDNLAMIRATCRDGNYAEAFFAVAKGDPDIGICAKAAEFAQRLDKWRTRARRQPLSDLIAAIYDQTGYFTYVLSQPGGSAKRANLLNLYNRACQFDEFTRQGLARFLRFIDQLQDEEADFGVASPMAENQDAVRIMSIHKSKGLEFPIVFVAELGRRFNMRDCNSTFMYSRDMPGIGIHVTDLERGVKYPTPAVHVMQRVKRKNQLAEEMRILYVALTRARDRLILAGSLKKTDRKFAKWLGIAATDPPFDPQVVLSAMCPLDWIGPALASDTSAAEAMSLHAGVPTCGAGVLAHASSQSASTDSLFQFRVISQQIMREWDISLSDAPPLSQEVADKQPISPDAMAAALRAIERMNWKYPMQALSEQPSRLTVSELKRRNALHDESGEQSGQFLRPLTRFELPKIVTAGEKQERGPDGTKLPALTATQRGNLMHLVLQHLDLLQDLDYAGISSQIDRMIDSGFLTEAQRKAIQIPALESFFQSELGARVRALPPDHVWREVPFILGLNPAEAGIEIASDIAADDATERIQIQGIIDCILDEPDGLVLIDYKTDAISDPQLSKRVEYYAPQIQLYALAIERILKRPVKGMYLHFLTLGKTVEMEKT